MRIHHARLGGCCMPSYVPTPFDQALLQVIRNRQVGQRLDLQALAQALDAPVASITFHVGSLVIAGLLKWDDALGYVLAT
jgi:DNA-binding IclR family transcriptional regulator